MQEAQTAATCINLDAAPQTKHFFGSGERAALEINVIFKSNKEVSAEESCRGYVATLMSQVNEAAAGLAETVAGQPRVQLRGRKKVTFQATTKNPPGADRHRASVHPGHTLHAPATRLTLAPAGPLALTDYIHQQPK